MPSVSKKQHNLMAMVANNPAKAKQLGIPQSVGEDFMSADKGKKFGKGGEAHEEKGEMKQDIAQDKKLIKKAFGMHDKQSHEGKKTNLSKLKGGGMATKKLFGGKESYKEELAEAKAIKSGKITPQQYARGEKSEGEKGMKKMAKGGSAGNGITTAKMGAVKSGGNKGKGEHAIQSKGLSKGTMITMKGSKPLGMKKGGKC